MMHTSRACLSLLFTLSSGLAQTFVVDAANGPGTDYIDLAAAALAAPDGAVLQVRPGFYFAPVTVDAKSLTILAEPNARLQTNVPIALEVKNLAAGQQFTLHGLTFTKPLATADVYSRIRLTDNAGAILLEQLELLPFVGFLSIEAHQCDQLLLRDCDLLGLYHQSGGRAAFESVDLRAIGYPSAAATVEVGELQVTDCWLRGDYFAISQTVGPAVQLIGGQLRVLGDSSLDSWTGPGPAVTGLGTVRLDPAATVLAGSAPFGNNITATTVAMPHVTSSSPALGNTIEVTLHGQPGSIGLLVGSPPSLPLTAPIFSDAWWLDPVAGVPLTAGIAPFQAAVATPANPALRGVRLNFQGLTWNGSGFDTSNPSGWVAR